MQQVAKDVFSTKMLNCSPYLPKFNGFIVGRKKKEGTISCLAPFNLVNFLLNFQALKIVKLSVNRRENCKAVTFHINTRHL